MKASKKIKLDKKLLQLSSPYKKNSILEINENNSKCYFYKKGYVINTKKFFMSNKDINIKKLFSGYY